MKVKRQLSKFYLWLTEFILGGFTELLDTEIDEIGKVRTFESENISGLYLFTNEILLNKKLAESKFEEAIKLAYYHEERHSKQELIKYGVIGTYLLSPPMLIIWILLITSLSYTTFTGEKIFSIFLFSSPIIYLAFTILIFLTAIIASYSIELDAELYVIDKLGLKNYNKGIEQMIQLFGKKSALKKFFIYIHHPPARFAKIVYKYRQES